jgi:uncharacterized protein YndB with AHSA1/START domain
MTGLTLVRQIAAPPSIVLDAFATLEGVRLHFHTFDGTENGGEYLKILRPKRLSTSWCWARRKHPGEPLLENDSGPARGHRTYPHPFTSVTTRTRGRSQAKLEPGTRQA